ncbi:hypothetical protein OJF2_34640 [Aquisphaera giovannonii]|uniref:Uncharacterized protein n=1 Tax=Aquisphaera giovannonii TaxID=406548 RepID=A0A5B9W404_9BACT|nr:hypothetical protein [Aquisphaera giovannonii]QEH34919.1 hypothetical protein OJF2_34640 [Aquisphaera giovannonii]
MGTLVAIYIRADDPATADAIRAEYPSAYSEPGTPFYAVDDHPYGWRPPGEALRALSARLGTEVLWLAYQSVVDAFEYHRWDRGARLRSLVFGCHAEERTWERSEGEPEPWERDAMFGAEGLASWSEGATDEERREYERIWSEESLEPGQTVPSLDAREAARAVAIHHRLPGWRDDWAGD